MKIFFSYAVADLNAFHIPELAQKLEANPNIQKVFYWNRDNTKELSIVKYMEKCLTECDVMVAFCSPNALKSGAVDQELDMAVYLNKQIIPIFRDINDVRLSLRPKRGIPYRGEIYQLIDDLLGILIDSKTKDQLELQRKIVEKDRKDAFLRKKKKIDQLEWQIETEDMELKKENEILDEIDTLKRELQELFSSDPQRKMYEIPK